MRFTWHRYASGASLAFGSDGVGKLDLQFARIHYWAFNTYGWFVTGVNGTTIVDLLEFDVTNFSVVNSDLFRAFPSFAAAAPGIDSSTVYDFGDEGMPLPDPKNPAAPNKTFILGCSSQNTMTGGQYVMILQWTYDFPYNDQLPRGPLFLS